jgi:hypothetical protein
LDFLRGARQIRGGPNMKIVTVVAGNVGKWLKRFVLGAVVLGVAGLAPSPVDAAPAERRHCDARLASDRVPMWDFPVLSVTTFVDFIWDEEGTKVRFDRRFEGWDTEFPTEGPVGTMYRISTVGPPFGAASGKLRYSGNWVLSSAIEITPQFERCAARLRESIY